MTNKENIERLRFTDLKICEGITSNWHYHLCHDYKYDQSIALCGRPTISSLSPIESWGYKPEHMPSSYCQECERIALDTEQHNDAQRNKVENDKIETLRAACDAFREIAYARKTAGDIDGSKRMLAKCHGIQFAIRVILGEDDESGTDDRCDPCGASPGERCICEGKL